MPPNKPEPPRPRFTTLSHTIRTGLARYDVKCKAAGISPFIDFSRFMSIVQAQLTIQKIKNGRTC